LTDPDRLRARRPAALDECRGTRGAVYVEFLAAFLPVFIMFECLVQLAGMYTAKLVVLHSAETAARAAVVVLGDDPKYYGGEQVESCTGQRRDDIVNAAAIPLRAVTSIIDVKVTFPSTQGGDDDRTSFGRNDLVRVKVQATYQCQVPFASRLVCDPLTKLRTLTGEAALPNNGADYVYSD
jgi:Flp pilus assembly protein TadG